MMPHISQRDKELSDESYKWGYFDKDGNWILREDAPEEIRQHWKRMKEAYAEWF